jgi:hypothetical protein
LGFECWDEPRLKLPANVDWPAAAFPRHCGVRNQDPDDPIDQVHHFLLGHRTARQ